MQTIQLALKPPNQLCADQWTVNGSAGLGTIEEGIILNWLHYKGIAKDHTTENHTLEISKRIVTFSIWNRTSYS